MLLGICDELLLLLLHVQGQPATFAGLWTFLLRFTLEAYQCKRPFSKVPYGLKIMHK